MGCDFRAPHVVLWVVLEILFIFKSLRIKHCVPTSFDCKSASVYMVFVAHGGVKHTTFVLFNCCTPMCTIRFKCVLDVTNNHEGILWLYPEIWNGSYYKSHSGLVHFSDFLSIIFSIHIQFCVCQYYHFPSAYFVWKVCGLTWAV